MEKIDLILRVFNGYQWW